MIYTDNEHSINFTGHSAAYQSNKKLSRAITQILSQIAMKS